MDEFDKHFFAGIIEPKQLASCRSRMIPWMVYLTFAGLGLKSLYVTTTILYLRFPVAGRPMVHWQTR